MSETRPILCARCNVAIEGRGEPDGQEIGFCPSCGARDTIENIATEAANAVAYLLEKKMHGMLSDAVRGNSAMTLTPDYLTERHFRFIVQME
jgi:hypothetical protein